MIDHRDHDPRPDIRERCAALLKIAGGDAPHAVARHGLLKLRDPDTVYHWLDRYQADGLDGLTAHRHGGTTAAPFAHADELADRLRQAPGEEARREMAPTSSGPPPSRWTLRGIRVTFDWLAESTLGGVWRRLDRCGLGLRTARVEQFSPDPAHDGKVRRLGKCLRAVAADPKRVVACSSTRWGTPAGPTPAPTGHRVPRSPLRGPNGSTARTGCGG